MAFREHDAPWRDPFTRADFVRIGAIWNALFTWIARHRHPHIRDISPHIARDLGFDAADLAQHRHRLPSQTHHHPRG